MKTKSFNIFAVTAMSVLALACAKEPVGGGMEAGVSFSVEVPGTQVTKAIGDGETATKLYYQVFGKDGAAIEGLGVQNTDITAKTATVKFQLVKDQEYNFVFWAQTDVDGYYTIDATDGLKKITANYTGKNSNDENFDAFYAVKKMTVTGPVSETVKLTRPFAQINIATAGQISAGTATKDIDFTGAASTVTVKGIPTVFSPLASNKFSDNADVTFAEAAAPAGNITVTGKDYKHLAVNYVFAPTSGTVYDIEATLKIEGKDVSLTAPTVPAKQNWKTNIVGDLLTTGADFVVVVVPGFAGSQNYDEYILNQAIAQGGDITISKDITVTDRLNLASGKVTNITVDKGVTLTGELENRTKVISLFDGNITCTLSGEGTILGPTTQSGSAAAAIELEDNTNELTIDGSLTIKGREGTRKNTVDAGIIIRAGKVVVNSGHFIASRDIDGGDNPAILLYSPNSYRSELIINGGTFESEIGNSKFLINIQDEYRDHASVKIYGGTFIGFDPADNEAEGAHTNFVAAGYHSTKVSTDVNGVSTYIVTKDGTVPVVSQEGFDAAIYGAVAGQPSSVALQPNVDVELKNGIANEGDNARELTFIGDGTQTFDVITKAINAEGGMLNYQRGSSFTFKNMTIQAGEGSFDGIVCDALTYENCTIKGKLTLYGKATFINCIFDNTMADQYSIWTWGGTDVTFEGCTFNTNGKAILLYGQATAAKPTNLTVSNCEFNDRKNGAAGKAAIEIGNDYNATYNLVISGCKVKKGFAEGKNTGEKVWANKNSMDAAHLSVTINGVKVL